MCRSILLCGVITQSTKETELQKGQWEWRLEVTGKFQEGEGWPKVEKRVVGNIGKG